MTCSECGRLDDDARGWKAYFGHEEDAKAADVFTFCPECAEREFDGGDSPHPNVDVPRR